MKCLNCGNELKEGARFCGNCGATVNATPDMGNNYYPPVKKNGRL